ncbi:DUF2092 domain-containing protein [Acuticoccus kandeliae]|uniref:DUF2092 domain-containing protein n=1 Tax=Acuticoccus kandeliae TaxID=2073160 RepID=UPI000D3EBC83|nr:DUF2092 domain-containing protein [Acuticoccus kandeliae]
MPKATKPAKIAGALVATLFVVAAARPAIADEAAAKTILKSMSDYLASQSSFAFSYDSSFDVVTEDGQALGIASSGKVVLERPDHVMATREGGYTNLEILFDGKTVTLVGKNANAYVETEAPDSVDALIDALHAELGFPMPGADLLVSGAADSMLDGVTDIKDLGAGVIRGVMCDHLAFRTDEVDWQIFIAQGDAPLPCRYVIVSKEIEGFPRYEIDFSDWATGDDVPETSFTFDNTTGAKAMSVADLRAAAGDLPPQFKLGAK